MKTIEDLQSVQLIYSSHQLLIDEAVVRLKKMLAGDDPMLAIETFNGAKITGDRVVQACQSLSFGAGRKLVVVSDYESLPTGDKAELAKYVADPTPSTVLVLCQGGTDSYNKLKADQRGKLYKAVSESTHGTVYEYKLTKGYAGWARDEFKRRGKEAPASLIDYLLAAVGQDLRRLRNEIDKLSTYFADEDRLDERAAREVITYAPEAFIFELVDGVALGRKRPALHMLGRLLEEKESEGRVFYMLERQFRLLLKTKGLIEQGQTEADIARGFRLPPFVIKGLRRQGDRMSWPAIRRAFDLLAEADLRRKSTAADPKLILEELVVELAELTAP